MVPAVSAMILVGSAAAWSNVALVGVILFGVAALIAASKGRG